MNIAAERLYKTKIKRMLEKIHAKNVGLDMNMTKAKYITNQQNIQPTLKLEQSFTTDE